MTSFGNPTNGLEVGQNSTFGTAGSVDVTGVADFDSGSTFVVSLDGTPQSGQYTQLAESPNSDTLGSGVQIGDNTTVAVGVGNGYAPVQNDTFDPIVANSGAAITGQFTNISTTTSGQSTTDWRGLCHRNEPERRWLTRDHAHGPAIGNSHKHLPSLGKLGLWPERDPASNRRAGEHWLGGS